MTVRVRFAPSPTGFLHIGGARTALYSYVYARMNKGTFVLRVEDTDLERSKKEFEESQIADLKWLGIDYDEGPERPGQFGPYRQSERLDIYKKHAEDLIDKGMAYYCFCTDDELDAKRKKAEEEKRAPHYDGTCTHLSKNEVTEKLKSGAKATIRFKVPKKPYVIQDQIRGEVTFPEDMVGDFVIIRSNGRPVYNFCCVIDDWLMEMSHVIRAEDHLPNTLRQVMIYEALGVKLPEFAHVSLLVGHDRAKLSKRHGATSVTMFREQGYLPESMVNYLSLLGWSHPDEKDVFDLSELLQHFNLKKLNKAAATFDMVKLNHINGQHLRVMDSEEILKGLVPFLPNENPFHGQSEDWKREFVDLFKEKTDLFPGFLPFIESIFTSGMSEDESLKEVLSWETTPKIKEFLRGEVFKAKEEGALFLTPGHIDSYLGVIKKELKIKGKHLFKGVRAVLTGRAEGSDLKRLVSLIPIEFLCERLK